MAEPAPGLHEGAAWPHQPPLVAVTAALRSMGGVPSDRAGGKTIGVSADDTSDAPIRHEGFCDGPGPPNPGDARKVMPRPSACQATHTGKLLSTLGGDPFGFALVGRGKPM